VRAPGTNRAGVAPPILAARLNDRVALETRADGSLLANIEGRRLVLGKFGAEAVARAGQLPRGLPLAAFEATRDAASRELKLLVRRLARSGLVEYRFGPAEGGNDIVVVEPQIADYWPAMAKLRATDTVALSRFAYLRRRGNEMVLESPRAGALFRICDPAIAAALAALSMPQKIGKLRRQHEFPGSELLALLLDSGILFTPDLTRQGSPRLAEGDDDLVLWDFHDLMFHTRTTEGRQANPLGGTYPYAGVIAPPPAVRPPWPGRKIDLRKLSPPDTVSPLAMLLRARHSIRDFDAQKPIALDELARFLDGAARVHSTWKSQVTASGPMVSYAARPYPSGGSAYELELYLTVANCEGLARGFYHYDAGRHALVAIETRDQDIDALLTNATFSMGASAAPQVLVTVAARFARTAWKYSSIAYALVLKDAGVLLQTLYLMATDLGLGGCAVGSTNIELFARMTGIAFHVEGPVCHFALGRAAAEAPGMAEFGEMDFSADRDD